MNQKQIATEINLLKERNKKVESDKAWETSATRKIILAAFTYFAIGIFLTVIQIQKPWLNAIVPAIGFMLSTLTMPFFKKIWLNKIYQK
jgi:hypothetical protein